ncbi:MAG: asparagine--tRNA ligase, partial [Bacteroidetes bacterium]|nr:asparagine--tRNA ligase [Bacteroidota bacterium]
EKSKTRRHLTEFWMIEPEMAFYDLDMNMDLAEEMVIRVIGDALTSSRDELDILERDLTSLERVQKPFPRITYDESVELLHSAQTVHMFDERQSGLDEKDAALKAEWEENQSRYGRAKKGEKRRIDARAIQIKQRQTEIEEEQRNLPRWRESAQNFEWGSDFGGSDETVLTWHFDRPIIVHRYPHEIKAFYMKRDPEDDRLAMGMDVLAPEGYGEIIGGGERATDLAFLEKQVADHHLPAEAFRWYFDLRRYGSVTHSGFGLGLERMITWICGIHHLREAIPFARTLDRLYP